MRPFAPPMHRLAHLARLAPPLALAALLPLAACGGGGDNAQFGDAPAGPAYDKPGGDANFTFSFEGVDSGGHRVQANLFAAAGTLSGSFADGSNISFSPTTDFQVDTPKLDVTGTYDTSGFTVNVAAIGVTYKGVFVAADVLDLTPTGGTTPLVLVRNDAGNPFAPNMAGTWTLTDGATHTLTLALAQADATNADVTVQLKGTEATGADSAVVGGWASVSHVHLVVSRASGSVTFDGFFASTATGWDPNDIAFANGAKMVRGAP